MESEWDVVVIGGGPAGMMAAGRAAEKGARVILIEKNASLGKKLLITGGGRCNITNAEFDTRKLLSKFKGSDKFLFSAFSSWNVQDTLDFFHKHNLRTKVEAEQRVFPVTDKAESVWNVLVEYMKRNNVTILSNSPVSELTIEENSVTSVRLKNGKSITAKAFILATGGRSRPETGSTGDGFLWLKKIGHTIVGSEAALVPIAVKDEWIGRLAGISMKDTKISIFQNDVKQDSRTGKILFTHIGLSGPTILNMSRDIGELLKYDSVIIELDIVPSIDYGTLNIKLQEIFKKHSNKKLKNSLTELIPSAFVPIIIEHSDINPETPNNSITREERLRLVRGLKHIRMTVKNLLGTDKAVITSGGVSLDEVNFKTMSSRLYPNLYFAGDILNIDRPSGGYSLQLCWTTGHVAGDNAF